MGEIAEMMLDGTLCEGCGGYLGSDSGIPSYCSAQCAADRGATFDDRYEPNIPRFNRHAVKKAPKPPRQADPLISRGGKVSCPVCRARVKITGLGHHMLSLHRAVLEKGLPSSAFLEVQPSDIERASWPDQTRAYVESLEAAVHG